MTVRRLERRRVLDGSLSVIGPILPAVITEGDLTVSATADGSGTLFFNWSLIQIEDGNSNQIQSVQQSSMPGVAVTTTLMLPDDNQDKDFVYEVRLRVTDGAQSLVTKTVTLEEVLNADPKIENLVANDVTEGGSTTLVGNYHDPGTADMHTIDIDWNGDNIFDEIDVPVSGGRFEIRHMYPDDDPSGTPQDTHNIHVVIKDFDGGSGEESTPVTVFNAPPSVIVTTPSDIVEGGEATTILTISDVGVLDVFSVQVDWSDGNSDTITDLGMMDDAGTVGSTDFTWEAVPRRLTLVHQYLDDDPTGTSGDNYSFTLTVSDDDTGQTRTGDRVFVENAPPVLTLVSGPVVNEGDVLDLSGMNGAMFLGSFTDVGIADTHTATIVWDVDGGSAPEPVTVNQSDRTLSATHVYADNDEDNLYTVMVTLMDDDLGSHTSFFEVTVLNVNPTLDPLTATDVDNTGSTTLQLSFTDPGADTFEVRVDWGDLLNLPPEERFMVEAVHEGPTPVTMTLTHVYAGPPDPLNPTADIVITVQIYDDDVLTEGVVAPGISNLESVAISNPGISSDSDSAMPFVDSTTGAPPLEFVQAAKTDLSVVAQVPPAQSQQRARIRLGAGETVLSAERFVQLCQVYPDGRPEKCFRIKDEALYDLRALFATLPGGRYRVYIVRTESDVRRLVVEVDVRRGQPVDIWDETEGTRDRPPTSESATGRPTRGPVPLEENPLLESLPVDQGMNRAPQSNSQRGEAASAEISVLREQANDLPDSESGALDAQRAGLGAVALVVGGWSQRVDAALAQASERDWRRLRGSARRRIARRPRAIG